MRTFPVVLVADRDPRDACVLVPLREIGQRDLSAVSPVDPHTGLTRSERVVRTDEQVAADVGEVATELQPRTGG